MSERTIMLTMREAPCKTYNVKVWKPRPEILKEAAPDLLEVCKAVLEWHRTFLKLDSELEKKLSRAIDKAEGVKERRPRRSRKGG